MSVGGSIKARIAFKRLERDDELAASESEVPPVGLEPTPDAV